MDKRSLTLAAMCLAVLMVQLDTTVVNLALHPIQTSLHTSLSTLQWVIDAYNLVYATFILTGATLGDRFGRKRLFMLGTVTFGVGTLWSALAPDASGLVVSRLLTGLGAAVALPVSLAIVTATFTEQAERNRAIALWSGVNGIAIALGPSAGGALVDRFGWRAIFVMFVPCVIAAFALTAYAVRESRSHGTRRLDFAGQALAVAALGAFAFTAIEGPREHWPFSTIATAIFSGLAFAAFVYVERRGPDALVDLSLFAERGFVAAVSVTFAMTFGMYTFLFIIPNYMQTVLHLSALRTGLLLLPLGAVFAVLSPFAGQWIGALGARRLIVIGMACQALGLAAALLLGNAGPVWLVVAVTTILGCALGFDTAPLMSVAMASSPSDRFGMASGIINVTRITGATVGVAVLGSLFASRASGNASAFVAGTRAALEIAVVVAVAAVLVAYLWIAPEAARRLRRVRRAQRAS